MSFLGDLIESVLGAKLAPEPHPKPATSPWASPAYHIEALGSATCPDCGAGKKVGDYRCAACARTKR